MATVDIVTCTRKGIDEEAKGPLTAMMQHTNCFCRGENQAPLHRPWECNRGKHSVRMMPPIFGSSVVHWARNQAVAQAMYGQPKDGRPDTEYFLLMDDDMVCEPGDLLRLMSYKLDIVCGICTIRRDPPRPNIRYWNPDESRFYDPLEWNWDSQKLMEIDGAGAAFMLIKRNVFELMGQAYLDCTFELEEYERMGGLNEAARMKWAEKAAMRRANFENAQKNGNWQASDCWWFCFLDNVVDKQIGEIGEDLSFCYKAKKLGFKVFADPQVLPGHLGNYAYSIRDYRAQVEAAKEAGNLKVPELVGNEPSLVPSA